MSQEGYLALAEPVFKSMPEPLANQFLILPFLKSRHLQFLTKLNPRKYSRPDVFIVLVGESLMNLVEHGDFCSGGKVGNMCAEIFVSGFYFDSKDGLTILEYNEINLSLIDVSKETKFHLVAFDVLLIMTKFQ